MRFDILTLFPEMVTPYLEHSILKRAQIGDQIRVVVHNIRQWATDRHRVTDEPPFGGGGGMILKPEPIFAGVEAILGENPQPDKRPAIILLTPQGRPFNQAAAAELARHDHIILICGRYEGVDERVRTHLVTDEISIGDYVLTGGELPALIVVDAVARLLPGVLGDPDAAAGDSHAAGLLEGAHFTRPPSFRGREVPAVLRSGHAGRIARWRRESALRRTWQRRPELLLSANLDEDDRRFLAVLAAEQVGNRES